MANQKINRPKNPKATKTFYFEPKFVASENMVRHERRTFITERHHTTHSADHAFEFSRIYWDSDYPGSNDFDEWCSSINSLTTDFQQEFNPSIEAFDFCKELHCERLKFEHLMPVLVEFMDAIKDYIEQRKEFKQISPISNESTKNFLTLVPLLAAHRPRIYIDSSNGCINVDVSTRDNGILSTQISGNGQIHYSYVAQNKKIFKLTGTAKFKDSGDFIKFNKVLRML